MSAEERRWEQRVMLVDRRKEIATGLFSMIMDGNLDPWLHELEAIVKLDVSVRIPIATTKEAHIALLAMVRSLVDEQIAMTMKSEEVSDDDGNW